MQQGTEGGYNIDGAILDKIESGELSLDKPNYDGMTEEECAQAELAIDEVVARVFENVYGDTENNLGSDLFRALAIDTRHGAKVATARQTDHQTCGSVG